MRIHPRLFPGVLVALLGTALLAAMPVAGGSGDDERDAKRFTHRAHVHELWAEGELPEVARDCRGCHVFAAEGTGVLREPQQTCEWCHYRAGYEPSHEAPDLSELRAKVTMAGFTHGDHANLSCRSCHAPTGGSIEDTMPIPRGFGVCVACHTEPATRTWETMEGAPAVASPNEGFAEGLNGSPQMEPEALGPFLHSEHLADPNVTDDLATLRAATPDDRTCGSCHAPTFDWTSNAVPDPEYALASCGECHLADMDGAPLRFELAPDVRSSVAQGTFDHAAHLTGEPRKNASNGRGLKSVENFGCGACHVYDDVEGTVLVGHARFAEGGGEELTSNYEGCLDCHAVPGWHSTYHGEHGEGDEPWNRPASEGSPGACLECHDFGNGMSLADARGHTTVERPRPSGFRVLSQTHPLISKGERDEGCIQCHRAEIDSLPSRLGERAFSHATHLGPDAGAESCLECHASAVENTNSPAEIGLNYDEASCEKCHLGAQLVPTFDPAAAAPRSVLTFPHRLHLEADGGAIDCATCHDPQGGTADEIGILESARTCAGCHDHASDETDAQGVSNDNWKVTGWITQAEVQSCERCHDREAGFVPATNAEPKSLPRTTVASVDAATIHPDGMNCTKCHIGGDSWVHWPATDPFTGDNGYAGLVEERDKRYLHAPRAQGVDPDRDEPFPTTCLDCHWNNSDKSRWSDNEPDFEDDPEGTRRDYGDMMAYPNGVPYPGWRKRDQ